MLSLYSSEELKKNITEYKGLLCSSTTPRNFCLPIVVSSSSDHKSRLIPVPMFYCMAACKMNAQHISASKPDYCTFMAFTMCLV